MKKSILAKRFMFGAAAIAIALSFQAPAAKADTLVQGNLLGGGVVVNQTPLNVNPQNLGAQSSAGNSATGVANSASYTGFNGQPNTVPTLTVQANIITGSQVLNNAPQVVNAVNFGPQSSAVNSASLGVNSVNVTRY
ncbi:MAG TPA: hypothetical protein VHP58_02285 [Alphaproteobacteria bacterium]|nr:hypothetical protein [Alphaproteobacteria bacterium]